jgi:hypothetical protein
MFKALTAAALLVSSLTAGAAPDRSVTLTTGLMHVPIYSGAAYLCTAVNVSATPLTVMLVLVASNGQVAVTSTQNAEPGVAVFLAANQSSGVTSGYCRVAFQGTPSSVRASLCNYQTGSCVSNLEAR